MAGLPRAASLELEEESDERRYSPQPQASRRWWNVWRGETQAAMVTGIVCALLFGFILFAYEPRARRCGKPAGAMVTDSETSKSVRQKFRASISADRIANLAREFSKLPHIAGSVQNTRLAQRTLELFQGTGQFDDVRLQRLPVLLMNVTYRQLTRLDPVTQAPIETLDLDEPNIQNQPGWSNSLPPTNGYTGAGKVRGNVVWANYGRQEDFDAIRDIDLRGTIVVVRYRKIFRGDKVKLAADRGAVGVIICHDPADMVHGPSFPHGPWANNYTVQRGSISLTEGDALTPTWPSEFDGPALSISDTFDERLMGEGMTLPKIPVQPISFGNAMRLLQGIGDGLHPLPVGWEDTGFVNLFANGIGPGPAMVELHVERDLKIATITNVFATVTGSEEPDRTVLFGSHRDAWTYGAGDPISGHSILIETALNVAELRKTGWRPRRSIQFCSWDAEEWSIIGSIEYVETNIELLRQRAVAYLNLDVAVRGNETMYRNGSPLLRHASEVIGGEVLLPSGQPIASLFEPYRAPGSGTDHVGFIQQAGVPILDCGIDYRDHPYEAVYHSNYDNFYWMSHFGDPGFVYHGVMAQYQGSLLLLLADSTVLPMHVEDYADSVSSSVAQYASNEQNSFANFSFLANSAALFMSAAKNHQRKRTELDEQCHTAPGSVRPYDLRAVNDISMGVERVFIGKGKEESGQAWYLHVIFTPSATDFYSATTMPLIGDALRSKNASVANFAMGRIAQFIRRAATFVNSTSVSAPDYANLPL